MNKQSLEMFKYAKYRVDFTWIKEHKFIQISTVDWLNNFMEAKDYIKETYYNSVFPISKEDIAKQFKDCDTIKVEVVNLVGNGIWDIYYWHN